MNAQDGPVAILAGSGDLPGRLVENLKRAGRPHRVLAFRGFCERRLRQRADAVVDLLDVRGIEARLSSWQPAVVTMAGGLTRPSPAALIGAYSAWRDRAEVVAIVSRGDDNLLRGAMELIESKGFPVVGVRELAPDLLAEPGPYGTCTANPVQLVSVGIGLDLLKAMSPFDVGQAVVVAGERVMAIEGPEGTDAMLARARWLAGWRLFRRRQPKGGVLVKAPKNGQDLRVDLPAIGPRTVRNAARAGLQGIAIASGLTVILRLEETIAEADRLGLFLMGVDMDAPQPRPSAAPAEPTVSAAPTGGGLS